MEEAAEESSSEEEDANKDIESDSNETPANPDTSQFDSDYFPHNS